MAVRHRLRPRGAHRPAAVASGLPHPVGQPFGLHAFPALGCTHGRSRMAPSGRSAYRPDIHAAGPAPDRLRPLAARGRCSRPAVASVGARQATSDPAFRLLAQPAWERIEPCLVTAAGISDRPALLRGRSLIHGAPAACFPASPAGFRKPILWSLHTSWRRASQIDSRLSVRPDDWAIASYHCGHAGLPDQIRC
jgi:hypothetical protein